MKICGKCKVEKSFEEFHKNKNTKDGLSCYCKNCKKILDKIDFSKHQKKRSESNKQYYQKNREKIIQYNSQRKHTNEYYQEYVKKNIVKIQKYRKEYYQKNKVKDAERKKQWSLKNKDKIRRRENEKLQNDVQHRLRKNLRNRLLRALKGNYKSGSAVRDLGCSIEELKQYLESRFQPNMTWKNWTRDGWHIDHIIPLSSFDLANKEQFLEACHYTNLQPLWYKENLSKGSQ